MSNMGAVFKEETITWKKRNIKMEFPSLGVEKAMRAFLMDRALADIEDQYSRHKNANTHREDLGQFRRDAAAGKYDFWNEAAMKALADSQEYLAEFCYWCAKQVKGQENITLEEFWTICRDRDAVPGEVPNTLRWRFGRNELFEAVDRLLLPDPPTPLPPGEAGGSH
jgi:hypothetical protein